MYIPVKVHGLSKPQISRLLNQHGVKLKIGGSLVVHVSKDQMKKLDRAHKKNGAAVITFDPFQIAQHQHLRGNMKGKGTRIEDQGVSSNDIANFLGVQQSSDPVADKQVTINQVKDAGARVKNFLGLGIKKRGRPRKLKGGDLWDDIGNAIIRPVAHAFQPSVIQNAFKPVEEAFKPAAIQNTMKPMTKQFRRGKIKKALKPVASTLIHQGIPIVASSLGGIAGDVLGGPLGGIAGGVAGEQAGNLLADYVGSKSGLGLKKKRGRPSKMGVGVGQKKVAHKKKAGRPRKGSALKAAGY